MSAAKNPPKKLDAPSRDDKPTPSSRNIEANLLLLQKIDREYKSFLCRSCGAKIPLGSPKEHIRNWTKYAKGTEPAQISGLLCQVKTCQKWTCIGCHQKPKLGSKTIPTSAAYVNHCCDKGRLFGIYILLSRFDEVELQLQEKAAKRATKKGWSDIRAGSGVGYATRSGFLSRRFGSSRSVHDGHLNWHATPTESCQQDDAMEGMFTDLLIILTAFLPNFKLESRFDKSPPSELFSLLRMSLLMDRVAALVRNDSIIDMDKRADLYNALLDFVTAISKHPILVRLLVEDRIDKKKSPGVQLLGDSTKRSTFNFDNSPSRMRASVIATGMQTLKHTSAFMDLSNNSALASDLRLDKSQDSAAITICRKFKECYKIVNHTAPNEFTTINSQSKDPWIVFSEKNRVDFTEAVLARHSLHAQFSDSRASRRGRMSALMKEIASLSTSLPPGIFLKISESRPDIMKVLIAGVEGSTYEGGLFAFDILLPLDWPVEPPKVYFVLEGHDDKRVAFNPNIHRNGRVCLSLLNTWVAETPEEKWQPNISTLLSVFVSIQAMILGVSDPYLNEPMRGNTTEANKFHAIYNQKVEQRVVQYAILYWLASEPAQKSVWYNIAKHYYGNKRNEVLARVRALGSSNKAVTGFVSDVEKHLGNLRKVPK